MNLKKLTALLFAGVTAAAPFATNAQNPTILQGNYISNVFGQANFVLNPNAQTNVANVTLTNATATRSTTTPLVATSEWNVTVTSANGTVAWATRTFDEGMKNQNCEARFTYRGFQATSKAQIKQGSNVVAELVLTPSATDPRIASINFPCGDLSSATTFVITDTATLSGTNEIGGIYVGLATNQANVAQAEFVGSFTMGSALGCNFTTTSTSYVAFTSSNASCPTPQGEQNVAPVVGQEKTPQFTVNAQKPGRYFIVATAFIQKNGTTNGSMSMVLSDGIDQSAPTSISVVNSATGANVVNQHTFNWTTSGTRTIQMKFATFSASNTLVVATDAASHNFMRADVYRFPSSSELVVTPETQNVWGAVKYAGSSDFGGTSTSYVAVPDSGFGSRSLLGNAEIAGSACGLSSGDTGFCLKNVPPGKYEVSTNISAGPIPTAAGDTCQYRIEVYDGSTTQYAVDLYARTTSATSGVYYPMGTGVVTIPAFAQNVGVVFKYKVHSGTPTCLVRSANTAATITQPTITFKPIDNNANSALYVQGPVKAAATGTAIPAGYVGEFSANTLATNKPLTAWNTSASLATVTIPAGVWTLTKSADARWGTAQPNLTRIEMQVKKSAGTGTINNISTIGVIIPCANMWPSTLGVYRITLACRPLHITSDGTLQLTFDYVLNGSSAGNNDWTYDLVRLN